jgi:hypothetical protein
VDGSGTGYLKTVCDYVHLNPVRAKLLRPEQRLAEYRWSSWPEYLKSPRKRPDWLRADRLMGEWSVREESVAGRRRLEMGMEQRKNLEWSRESGDWKQLRRGWCWGPKDFREELLERIGEKQGNQHHGEELRESDEQKAERLVGQMMKRLRWTEEDLTSRAKGERNKAKMAARLRSETTMTWAWITRRLKMGHWRTAANATRTTK